MADWMQLISTQSLDRGIDYFESGSVLGLAKVAGGWEATVVGSDDYRVFVPDSMDPYQASCTCPHFAGGSICKHIAATCLAVEQRMLTTATATATETIEGIVRRIDLEELRTFVIETAHQDEYFERELRATFGIADPKEAKRELQKVTTNLMHSYERGGFIDWRSAMEFEREYTGAIESIMRPFYTAKDVEALIDLLVPRFVQLQRICIDDSDGFFTTAFDDVAKHLNTAFELGDLGQRTRLFDLLEGFMNKNPGRDRGDIYWLEQETAEEFLVDRYVDDAGFAPRVMTLADDRLADLPSADEDAEGHLGYERAKWAGTRLRAMATLGDTPAVLRAYAESHSLLESADAIRLLADAYFADGQPAEAMSLLSEHLDAREAYRSMRLEAKPPRIVDRLVAIAQRACDDTELAHLYTALLCGEPSHATTTQDQGRWYDELHRLTGEDAWVAARAEVLSKVSYATGNTLLAHEGSFEELFERIMAQGGADLRRFESDLAETHPEPYIDLYIGSALSEMDCARDRHGYRHVADELAHAARLRGGKAAAQQAAVAIRAQNPRRPALHDELRKAGFEV